MKKIALALVALLLLSLVPIAYAHEKDKEVGSEEENSKFKIQGQVESISDGSFVVNGQTIYIDLTQVSRFGQRGIIDVGDSVKVKGLIKDGKNYAQDIRTIGEGQGRFMLKIKGLFTSSSPSPSPSPTASASPESSPSPSPSGSPSPTASASASPTASPSVMVKVKAAGPIELVTQFLQQVLAYLQGLL